MFILRSHRGYTQKQQDENKELFHGIVTVLDMLIKVKNRNVILQI
ncbi:hypothetical protein FACS1894174_00710 [Bacteroidia bacterium]|nr:hypothetical protein FACS1894174_00710 [Bacteroidia bacterium]